jgi:hypothetical protein
MARALAREAGLTVSTFRGTSNRAIVILQGPGFDAGTH